MPSADVHRARDVDRGAVARGEQARGVEDAGEQAALLGEVDRVGAGAEDRHAGRLEALREPEGGLPAELHDDADELAASATPRG